QTRKESTSALRHALQEGRSFQCEVENYRADGERYWLEIGVSIMDSPLLPEKMFVAVERDITHRKFMEDELRTAKAREERDRALTKQRLDSAALRLRGPVHQLTGAFELLSESVQAGEPTDELVMGMFAEHLAILEECIQSMEEPEAPEQERESRGVHLSELCSGSRARVQHPALLRGIGLQFEQVGSEGRVAGRYGELLDAFGRILDNAVRVSPVGGRVTMTAVQSGACFEISTVDEGPGFSLQDRQRAFEDFYQGEHASAEGHGLGLGRCREVVEALGGEVWIDSEHSPGARIVVALPTSLHQEPPQPTL
ncbi:MAG: ATP-binding protein, partial [Myxococcota bacterium]